MKIKLSLSLSCILLFSCTNSVNSSLQSTAQNSISTQPLTNSTIDDNSSSIINTSDDAPITSENNKTSSKESTSFKTNSPSNSSLSSQISNIDESNILKNPRIFPSYEYTYSNATTLQGTVVNASLDAFSCEGYAEGVTGGGNLTEIDENYIKVSTPSEFMTAISRKNINDKTDTLFPTKPMVIEITNDIDLGYSSSGIGGQFADMTKANDASTHPTLKTKGVSVVYITGRQNLTIFSKNGSKISHACFQIRGYDSNGEQRKSSNIIIRNLEFDGLYEWDDSGKYDNNDWDQFTIRGDKVGVEKIWIDHCTFHKTYDGTIDIKYGATDITISWCAFIPYDESDEEFMEMMNYLENNRSSFPNYNAARNSGASFQDMINYASINKKVHLVGHSDNNAGDENIRVTYCNNYYLDCVERLPRLRLGNVHVYNNIYDASETEELKLKIRGLSSWPAALGFSENGSQSTNYGHILMENCYINGINTPLRNNMKKVDSQYVGSIEALYTYYTCQNINRSWDYSKVTNTDVSYNGRYTFKGNSVDTNENNLLKPFPSTPLSFDTQEFKNNLGYEYTLYEPETLYVTQNNKVGANALNFSITNWLTSDYANLVNDTNITLPNGGVKGSSTNLNLIRN